MFAQSIFHLAVRWRQRIATRICLMLILMQQNYMKWLRSNSSSIRVYLHFFSFTNCTIHHSTSHRNRWTSTIYLKYALCYLPKNRYSPSSGFIPKIYFVWLNKFTYIRLKINRHKCAGDFLSEILKNPAHETFLRFFNSIRFRCGENSLIFILLLLFFSYKSDRWHMIKCMFSLLPIRIHNESVTIHNFTQFTQLSIRFFFYVNKKMRRKQI